MVTTSPIRCGMTVAGMHCDEPAVLAATVASVDCDCRGEQYTCAGHTTAVVIARTWEGLRCGNCGVGPTTAVVVGNRPLNEGDLPDDPSVPIYGRWLDT